MDQETLVDRQISDGESLIRALHHSNFDVAVAFWIKPAEDHQWFFYIASDEVSQKGLAPSFRQVYAVIRSMPSDFSIERFDIKLIGDTNPIACDAMSIRDRYVAPLGTWFRGIRLGQVQIESAFIYPAAVGLAQP